MIEHLKHMARIRPGLDGRTAQWALDKIGRLELENRLMFAGIKDNEDDLTRFNSALASALDEQSAPITECDHVYRVTDPNKGRCIRCGADGQERPKER